MSARIFYLEDEPFLARIVKETLEKQGFQVHHVNTGANAVEAYLQFQPDICLLDVMVPVIDGFAVGKSIRTKDAHIPIIYLTAKVQSADVVEGFNSGGTDYLRKPFSMEELLVRIDHQLKWKSQAVVLDHQFDFGQFSFDAKKQELRLGEVSHRLSFRESQLLRFLLERKEGIAERKDILMELWGDDSYFNSRNLDVYIKKLRDRLKKDENIQILTLKGVGYRLVEE